MLELLINLILLMVNKHQKEHVHIIQKNLMYGLSKHVVPHLTTAICALNNLIQIQLHHLQLLNKAFARDMQ